MDDTRVSEVGRRLRSRADAILGAVWFMPEARTGFTELGLSPSASSLGSRGACLGRVRGEVVAALFAPLHPSRSAAAVEEAWQRTEPETLLAARLRCATAYLESVLGPHPVGIDRAVELLRRGVEAASTVGHPVFAGLRALPWPGWPLGDLWRASDMVRERRGGSHLNAWVGAGLRPIEIQLLTERWRTRPNPGSATAEQLGYSAEATAAGLERLRERGFLAGDALNDAGRTFRDRIEEATDRQEADLVEALGTDADELLELLEPWARAVIASAGTIG